MPAYLCLPGPDSRGVNGQALSTKDFVQVGDQRYAPHPNLH